MAKGTDVDSSYVAIGKVVKAQGLEGQVKVSVYSGTPEDIAPIPQIFLGSMSGLKAFTLLRSRSQGKFAIVSLAEIVDRDGAEAQVGQQVWALKSQMPPLAPDEFYWHEMVGLLVKTVQGQELGRVTSLIATKAHDVMVVTGLDQGECLIPVVREIVISQDLQAGVLIIAPPPGLLEMNSPDAL